MGAFHTTADKWLFQLEAAVNYIFYCDVLSIEAWFSTKPWEEVICKHSDSSQWE